MKRIALFLILAAIVPLEANAFNTYDHSDVLSYVAMPLAVSAVCDVRGVQTDRVGQLVAYMDQANVAPADFIDVFRYVPVALVLRTDNRPDFVEWVHGQVDRGLVGEGLVTAMETQLRTYDTEVPQAGYRSHRRYARSEDYAYAYEPDYVPVVIRRHCDRFFEDSLPLVVMPLAVDDVCDLGVPYDRVSSLAVELNLGDVGPTVCRADALCTRRSRREWRVLRPTRFHSVRPHQPHKRIHWLSTRAGCWSATPGIQHRAADRSCAARICGADLLRSAGSAELG